MPAQGLSPFTSKPTADVPEILQNPLAQRALDSGMPSTLRGQYFPSLSFLPSSTVLLGPGYLRRKLFKLSITQSRRRRRSPTVHCSRTPTDSCARRILDAVYGATPLSCVEESQQNTVPTILVVNGSPISIIRRSVILTEDQRQALAIGTTPFPIVGIQAVFGTDKTVVGACVAARQARGGSRIIVTATTNAAVAQITDTILSVDAFADLPICHYIAESVVFDGTIAATPADMHEILKRLPDLYRDKLEEKVLDECERSRYGRIMFKAHMQNRERQEFLTEQEREDLVLAESDVPHLIDKVVEIMFLKISGRRNNFVVLLNATGKGGIFKNYFDDFELIICDEASQVPEPFFATRPIRLPKARHIYIGDVYQLEPYARCSRYSTASKFGARSVMDVLTRARAVPMTPLVTAFRAHPLVRSYFSDAEAMICTTLV
ncbi:unnamed protein product [Heligmosomoides polygyrus]|uniref:DNA2/NAM7 helicase helicase domain-containing protein n=1 Tax=Heligmosomoides polygyrus TaxID=6339 RepID=A0A3P7V670_HELPZ|nr:unnamed protein product [Heligmosomoides polygyrus]